MVPIEKRDILLVTKDNSVREILKSIFSASEYHLAFVAERREVESAIRKEHARVIVIDGDMPGLDVPHLLNDMHREHIRLPVIVISGDSSLDFAKKIREEGIFYFASRPVDTVEIKLAVDCALKKAGVAPADARPDAVGC